MTKALAWTPSVGHANIAPSRFERIEGDGYFTLDSEWIVPALLGAVPIKGRLVEPAAGGTYICCLSSNAPALSSSPSTSGPTKIRSSPLVAVTNLPYGDLEGLAEILVRLGSRDRCGAPNGRPQKRAAT